MRKEEKVHIELPAAPARKPRGVPTCSVFSFKPRTFPFLKDSVVDIAWNAVAKQLKLTLKETSKFEVYEWMAFITGQDTLYEKTPFMDVDTNSADLTIFDKDKNSVVTLRFKNLRLIDHHCEFNNALPDICLKHDIVLNYRNMENITATTRDEDFVFDTNEISDEEWKIEIK